MPGFSALTPNIGANTASAPLRIELLNTFARLDGQLKQAPFSLFNQVGASGNSGSVETDLMQVTVNFGTLQLNGQSLFITAAGNTAANANNKTLKLKFGGSTIFDTGAFAGNDISWTFQGEIIRSGGSAQVVYGQFFGSATLTSKITTSTAAVALASNQILKFTGTGTASSDISISFMRVLLLN